MRAIMQRAAKQDILQSAATENPQEIRKVVAELRALIDAVEQAVL
jgi:hypothetical protein